MATQTASLAVHARSPSFEGMPYAPLDPLALEAVTLNLEASLRVYTEQHFFAWTQGALQNLVRHEALICALRSGDNPVPHVDLYTMAAVTPGANSNWFQQDGNLAQGLVRAWENNSFQPLLYDLDKLDADEASLRELQQMGATQILAHGTHDASGHMVSFFIFARQPDDGDAGLMHRVEMLVPFLHTAWMRTKASFASVENESGNPANGRDLLTSREQEVLKWVYLGKSNIEIGMILGISALTVKNHVQEILRRLNVQNRAQAVGKAFNLHILSN